MKREIEIRVFERTDAADPHQWPDERDIYTFHKTIDISKDNASDVFDEAKMAALDAMDTEVNITLDEMMGAYDDEDRQSDRAKALHYHRKHGDAL